MNFSVEIKPYTLNFKRPAGTSRGVYHKRPIWLVIIRSKQNETCIGVGECAPLFDLSCDYSESYEENLCRFAKDFEEKGEIDYDQLRNYPSILLGFETALRHFQQGGRLQLWDTRFSRGERGIPINGLIWMGDFDSMYKQIESKMEAGFRCIKLKIGAIDFEKELSLLKHIRKHFSSDAIELRVDANGAFPPEHALKNLKQLSEFDIHSIEQPIRSGQWDEMRELIEKTPIPIVLDEELIGINDCEKKSELLQALRPHYIILKPSLHGGLKGAEEWIALAEDLHIDWWVTSALESNIGLSAIAQWCSTFRNVLPQGLGTGSLYTNNFNLPMEVRGDCLWMSLREETSIKSIFDELRI